MRPIFALSLRHGEALSPGILVVLAYIRPKVIKMSKLLYMFIFWMFLKNIKPIFNNFAESGYA